MKERTYVEVDKKIAQQVKLYCVFRGIKMYKFVTESLKKELEPYNEWLENVKKCEK